MGCDIHCIVQIKTEKGWERAELNYHGRNYNVFAILANVRNGSGFAGIKTSDGFKPISEPRGLPPGMSEDDGEFGDHSFSHVTAKELVEVDFYNATTTLCGWIDFKTYKDWTRYARGEGCSPDTWSGGVSGKDILKYTEADYLAQKPEDTPGLHIFCEWEQTYARAIGLTFLTFVLEMARLGQIHGMENVRFVFGFDS